MDPPLTDPNYFVPPPRKSKPAPALPTGQTWEKFPFVDTLMMPSDDGHKLILKMILEAPVHKHGDSFILRSELEHFLATAAANRDTAIGGAVAGVDGALHGALHGADPPAEKGLVPVHLPVVQGALVQGPLDLFGW